VNTFGTAVIEEEKIEAAVKEVFSFKPANLVAQLDLLRPIYLKSTNYGHFGREDAGLPWEEVNRVDELKSAVS
jgi:S-adenosylmethionine synthetase